MVVWVGSLALAGGRWGVVARLGWLKLGGVKQADWARVSRGLDCFVESTCWCRGEWEEVGFGLVGE